MPRSPLVCQASASSFSMTGPISSASAVGPLLEEDHLAADGQISVDAGQRDVRQHENQDEFECKPHVEFLLVYSSRAA